MKNSTVYKIKNGKGLYSNGGTTPKFNKIGKCWSSIGGIKNHLRQFQPKPRKYVYMNDNYNDGYEVTKEKPNQIPSDWVLVEFTETREVMNCNQIFKD